MQISNMSKTTQHRTQPRDRATNPGVPVLIRALPNLGPVVIPRGVKRPYPRDKVISLLGFHNSTFRADAVRIALQGGMYPPYFISPEPSEPGTLCRGRGGGGVPTLSPRQGMYILYTQISTSTMCILAYGTVLNGVAGHPKINPVRLHVG
jgi:hypothetical protein